MSIDQAGLEAAIEAALAPHGFQRGERTPGEEGRITREGWSAFLFPKLGEAALMWGTPEDSERFHYEKPTTHSRDLDDTAMRLDRINRIASILNDAGFLGEADMTPNGTPLYRMTRIPA